MKQKVLITGAAGFVGYHLSQRLLNDGFKVIGIDNLYKSYNPQYKKQNIEVLSKSEYFIFQKADILKQKEIEKIFQEYKPDYTFHLAALTGVRNSLKYPKLYFRVNNEGTCITYQYAYKYKTKKFIFASSSSVYGNSKKFPFSEDQPLSPESPYAQSKAMAEQSLKEMHFTFKIPTILVRFFSVYGPYGRPDMAPYLFTKSAYTGKPIPRYGKGETARDYTYIDDIIDGLVKILQANIESEIINLGNSHPIKLKNIITLIEKYTQKKITIIPKPANKNESKITYADISKAKKILNWVPQTKFEKGLKQFIVWYQKNRL